MSTLRVSQIHLVRSKKLKSGKVATRHHKIIYNPKTSVGIDGAITVDVDHRWASGQMVGKVDKNAGTVHFEDKPLEYKGYLKGRNFKLIGYNLDVRFTTTYR